MQLVTDIREAMYCEGDTLVQATWYAVVSSIRRPIRRLICRLFGHRMHTFADAENGHEEIWCERCDYSDSCWMG